MLVESAKAGAGVGLLQSGMARQMRPARIGANTTSIRRLNVTTKGLTFNGNAPQTGRDKADNIEAV